MIGLLTGFINSTHEDHIILDVMGVGYKVYCSAKTLDKIQGQSDKVSLLIETVVKEDSITLFGFLEEDEQNCFNLLCKVSGVGNKMTLKIMSIANVSEIFSAIVNEDKNLFCRASGVGPKVALRIINELKGNPSVKSFKSVKGVNIENGSIERITNSNESIAKDAIMALEGLGYQKSMVQNIVIKLVNEKPHLTLESIITESLKTINNF